MMSSSTKSNDKWIIDCPGYFFWTSSIRRLHKYLTAELQSEYFELLDYTTLRYQIAEWRDHSCWILDRLTKALETDGFSFTLRFRGLQLSATAIHLQGYFDVTNHAVKFSQLTTTLNHIFRDYGCSALLGHCSIPIVHFKTVDSSNHLPLLTSWTECEFGELRFSEWIIRKSGKTYATIPLQQFIAHRGNVSGRYAADENSPKRIEELNRKGIACEIDVWFSDGGYWLGHDEKEHKISYEWLMEYLPLRLIHCKNREALDTLHRDCGKMGYEVNLFYHTVEDYALTSRGHIIVHPDQPCFGDSIEMMPELSGKRQGKSNCVCSDSTASLTRQKDEANI